jgi:hypothetical protein
MRSLLISWGKEKYGLPDDQSLLAHSNTSSCSVAHTSLSIGSQGQSAQRPLKQQ